MNNLLGMIYRRIVDLIDNPITQGLALAMLSVPVYFYIILPFIKWLDVEPGDYTNIQQFIEWFGVPYGLLLALVLVNVWTQYDTTERAFDREEDAVFALYNTFLLVSGKQLQSAMVDNIRMYIDHVIAHYADEYKDYKKAEKNIGDNHLNNLRTLVGDMIKKRRSTVITTELLRLINELIDDRGDRLSYSKQRMPRPVLVLSIIASILWLAPFFVLNFENFFVGAFFIGGVTFIVVSILLIIYDLDNPFTGTWGLELDAWKELKSKIK